MECNEANLRRFGLETEVATETESNEALSQWSRRVELLTRTGLCFACKSAGVSTSGRAHSSAIFLWYGPRSPTRMLGSVLDRQPTVILPVSFRIRRKRKRKKKEKKKVKE